MKQSHPIGLGEPTPEGKLSLFKPPQSSTDSQETLHPIGKIKKRVSPNIKAINSVGSVSHHRIRTTIDLTSDALVILQQVQQEHRLRTGKALPIWKALSHVITSYYEIHKK